MIIALISDIHGNLPALKAVLDDVKNMNAKEIWCLGDLVGYIPFPNECIELIQKKASASIVGNYDLKVIDFKRKEGEWKKSKKPAKFDAFEWNNQNLNSQSRKYLGSLPQNIRRKIGRNKILMTHGSPQSIEEPVLPETHEERLIELGNTANANIIIMGHTHRFMNRQVGNQFFINPGSAGLPINKDLRASYALLKISQEKITVTERKIEYDISEILKRMRKASLSGSLVKMIKLEYGIDLKDYDASSVNSAGKMKSGSQFDLRAVRQLAREYNYEKQHSEHVTSLALSLFDELKPMHKLTNKDRFILDCAAILHDIGWIEGQKGHHKTAMKSILNSQILPFTDHQRRMIALIARYHRKTLPKESHPLFSQLSDKDKQKVRILAGILRIADGLDRTHTCAVRYVECDVSNDYILVKCRSSSSSDFEIEAASRKSDLLQSALSKNIRLIIM